MSELSFLLSLLLEHKLPTTTKKVITDRIREVEEALRVKPGISNNHGTITYNPQPMIPVPPLGPQIITLNNPDGSKSEIDLSKQSPSMRNKLLAEQQAQVGNHTPPQPQTAQVGNGDAPQGPVMVANTPATMAALEARRQAINIAVSGKEEKGRSSPRKF